MLFMKQSKGQGRAGFRKWIRRETAACHHLLSPPGHLAAPTSFTSASLALSGSDKHHPRCQHCSPLPLLTTLAGKSPTVKGWPCTAFRLQRSLPLPNACQELYPAGIITDHLQPWSNVPWQWAEYLSFPAQHPEEDNDPVGPDWLNVVCQHLLDHC